MKRDWPKTLYSLLSSVLFILLAAGSVSAQVRTSTNYQLQSDALSAGGLFSTSTSFQSESTIGEIATGLSTSTSFELNAGYQQLQEIYLSLSGVTPVTMSPNLPGVSGGVANGSTTVTVLTDNPAGYQLTIEADRSPAMQRADGESIANYDAGGTPDFTFTTPVGSALFGYSPEGVDVAAAFLDTGLVCGSGSLETAGACWDGLTTSPVTIAESTSANHPLGATTTVQFQLEINQVVVESGTYIATTTLTALPL